jgi:PAS domain-containing protein
MSPARKKARPINKRASLVETHLARLPVHGSLKPLLRYLDHLPVAALVADNTGAYVAANRAAVRLVGYTADELRAMSTWDLVTTDDEHEIEVLWRNFLRGGTQRGTISLRTKKGADYGPVCGAGTRAARISPVPADPAPMSFRRFSAEAARGT